MGVFALLISRLSTFESHDPSRTATLEAVTNVLETDFANLVTTREQKIVELNSKLQLAQKQVAELEKAAAPQAEDAKAPPPKA